MTLDTPTLARIHPTVSGQRSVRRYALVLVALTGVITLGMAVLRTPARADSSSVSIMNYAFSPSSLTIHVGDKVTRTNMDDAPHTVTSSSGPTKLDSPTLNKGDTWSYTFTHPGDYSYYCAVHANMKGTIKVLPAGAPSGGGSNEVWAVGPEGPPEARAVGRTFCPP